MSEGQLHGIISKLHSPTMNRRRFLRQSATAAALPFAGCGDKTGGVPSHSSDKRGPAALMGSVCAGARDWSGEEIPTVAGVVLTVAVAAAP